MANTATVLKESIPIGYERTQAGVITSVVKAVIDTTGTDLTLYTPSSENYVAIIGLQYAEADAHNLTYTSGSTVLVTLQQAANTVVNSPIGQGVLLTTISPGDAIKIQSSVAIAMMLFYIQEFKDLRF